MKSQCMKKRWVWLLWMILMLCLIGCQPTPEQEAVQNKGDAGLMDKVQDEAQDEGQMEEKPHFVYEKEYENNIKLTVDAEVCAHMEGGAAILSIAPDPFKNGEQLEKLVRLMYPEAEIYKQMEEATKEDYEERILQAKQQLYKYELVKNAESDDPFIDESMQNIRDLIADYEAAYSVAPEERHDPATYEFRKPTDTEAVGEQCNLFTYGDNPHARANREEISFWNDELGSGMMMRKQSVWKTVSDLNAKMEPEFCPVNQFAEDTAFRGAKEAADTYVRHMGIDYMQADVIRTFEGLYEFTYTRTYRGLQETYIAWDQGSASSFQMENSVAMKLWQAETLVIWVYENEVIRVTWINPSKITAIDHESVKLLPWEEVEQRFQKQMDYYLTASGFAGMYESFHQDVRIDRVELGYAKLLVKDAKEYKLIPVWSFIGAIVERETGEVWEDICFATINAIDGTVIDRGLMY